MHWLLHVERRFHVNESVEEMLDQKGSHPVVQQAVKHIQYTLDTNCNSLGIFNT